MRFILALSFAVVLFGSTSHAAWFPEDGIEDGNSLVLKLIGPIPAPGVCTINGVPSQSCVLLPMEVIQSNKTPLGTVVNVVVRTSDLPLNGEQYCTLQTFQPAHVTVSSPSTWSFFTSHKTATGFWSATP